MSGWNDEQPIKPKRRKRAGKKPRGSMECALCRVLVWATALNHSGRCGDCARQYVPERRTA
jgi:hypothetical protein